MKQFYAYIHCKPDATPFYVGKGFGGRALNLDRKHNKHHASVVGKYGKDNILVGKLDCSSEDAAFELEKGLIKCLRRMGVKLANATDGGEGASGLTHSEDFKIKMTVANPMRTESGKTAHKISRIGYRHSEATRGKIGEKHKNKIVSMKTRQLLSSINTGKKLTQEHRDKIGSASSRAMKGCPKSEAHKIALSEYRKGSRSITDGLITKVLKLGDLLPSGWKYGTAPRKNLRKEAL